MVSKIDYPLLRKFMNLYAILRRTQLVPISHDFLYFSKASYKTSGYIFSSWLAIDVSTNASSIIYLTFITFTASWAHLWCYFSTELSPPGGDVDKGSRQGVQYEIFSLAELAPGKGVVRLQTQGTRYDYSGKPRIGHRKSDKRWCASALIHMPSNIPASSLAAT